MCNDDFLLVFSVVMHYKCDGHITNRWNEIRHTHTNTHVHRNVRQMIYATEHHFELHSFLLNGILPPSPHSKHRMQVEINCS